MSIEEIKEEVVVAGQPYLSPSRVSTFLGCEFLYDMKYIKLVPQEQKGKIPMLLGTCVDSAFNAMYSAKIAGTEIPMEEILTSYEEQIKSEWTRMELPTEKQQDIILNGFKLINMYSTSVFSITNAIAVQKELNGEIQFNGIKIPIKGYLDLETDDTVFDHKVTARSAGGKMSHNHWFQLATYSILTGKRNVAIIYLLNQKTPRIEILKETISDNDIRYVNRMYYQLWKRIQLIESGEVSSIPNRNYQWCSLQGCDFGKQCADYYKGYLK